MPEINLLQNRLKDTTFTWERQSKRVISALSVILIIILGAAAIFFLLNHSHQAQLDKLTADNRGLQQQLTDKQASLGTATVFQAQLVNLRSLVASHVFVSPLLDEISKATYVKAQYVTLDITQTGKIHLEGRVATYNDLGKLLLGLTTAGKFKNVKLLSVSPSTGKDNAYQFSIDMDVIPEIFTKK